MPSGRGTIQGWARAMAVIWANRPGVPSSPSRRGPKGWRLHSPGPYPLAMPALPPVIADWFAARGWAVRRHQQAMLDAAAAGRHALLVAPTGAGKTLAGFLPSLADLTANPRAKETGGLHSLYVS